MQWKPTCSQIKISEVVLKFLWPPNSDILILLHCLVISLVQLAQSRPALPYLCPNVQTKQLQRKGKRECLFDALNSSKYYIDHSQQVAPNITMENQWPHAWFV